MNSRKREGDASIILSPRRLRDFDEKAASTVAESVISLTGGYSRRQSLWEDILQILKPCTRRMTTAVPLDFAEPVLLLPSRPLDLNRYTKTEQGLVVLC